MICKSIFSFTNFFLIFICTIIPQFINKFSYKDVYSYKSITFNVVKKEQKTDYLLLIPHLKVYRGYFFSYICLLI